MNLKEIYSQTNYSDKKFFYQKQPVISFEIFPPKDITEEKNVALINELNELKQFDPKLISVTYGAGGSAKQKSLDLVKLVKQELEINVMPHFTCVNATEESVSKYLDEITEIKIKNILALRGDMPINEQVTNFDFKYANDLVKFIKEQKYQGE